uniref:Transposase (Putative), gypsy type n=1 Tax=Tanacetum cinerariifolium TaxID=118510 RepID=A0A6L2MH96_TANCI|nr:hypothetical protein [Tanacetum cinerariifolium]
MDLLSFIRTADPTRVRIGERERDEDEPKLLETTVGCVVLLLPVTPDCSSGELKASVDKPFNEGGSGEQSDHGDSTGGGHGVDVQLGNVSAETVVKDVAPAELQRKKKQKTKVVDDGEPSHPGVGGGVMPTLPFVSSFVSTTPKRKVRDYTELLAGANLRTLEAPQRFVISSDSSDHSGANIAEAEVDFVIRTSMPIMMSATPTADPATIAKERLVGSLVFGGDSIFASRIHPISGGFFDRTGSDFLVGGIRTIVDPDSSLQRVYVPLWNVTNGFCMDVGGVYREMVDEFVPPPHKFFASIHRMEHDQLFTEFNVGAARQISLSAKVRMHVEYNIKEKRRLKSVVREKDSLLKSRCDEIESLKAQLLIKKTEAAAVVCLRDEAQALKERNTNLEKEKSYLEVKVVYLAASVKVRKQEVAVLDVLVTSVKLHNDSLSNQVNKLKASSARLQEKVTMYENCMSQLEKFQDEKIKEVNEKFDKLCVDFVDMALHLEEKFYPHLLTTIFRHRTSTDVAAYTPSAEAHYLSALQRLQSVNFPLITGLKTNKDASVEVIMNLLRLKDTLAKKLGLVESQPYVDQLMVPIYYSPDQRVVGASTLSLSLDVSSSRVQKIKENIANHVSALHGVFVPLCKPLSAMALVGMEGTSGVGPDTTTALSVTSISASTISPISIDDYEIAHTEGGEGAVADVEAIVDEGADPFLDVSGAELDILE